MAYLTELLSSPAGVLMVGSIPLLIAGGFAVFYAHRAYVREAAEEKAKASRG